MNFRDNYVIIGQKGIPKGQAIEAVRVCVGLYSFISGNLYVGKEIYYRCTHVRATIAKSSCDEGIDKVCPIL